MVFPCSAAGGKQLTEFTEPNTITSIKISKFDVQLIPFIYLCVHSRPSSPHSSHAGGLYRPRGPFTCGPQQGDGGPERGCVIGSELEAHVFRIKFFTYTHNGTRKRDLMRVRGCGGAGCGLRFHCYCFAAMPSRCSGGNITPIHVLGPRFPIQTDAGVRIYKTFARARVSISGRDHVQQ